MSRWEQTKKAKKGKKWKKYAVNVWELAGASKQDPLSPIRTLDKNRYQFLCRQPHFFMT